MYPLFLKSLYLFLFIVVSVFTSCEEENNAPSGDPSGLVVDVNVDEDGLATINATAENAVEYQLRVGNNEEPDQTNTSGNFEYSFTQTGIYQLDVRAYGESGRFIRELLSLPVSLDDGEVSAEDGYTTPVSYEGYQLVWNDEFDGDQINTNNWVFETGDGCPGLCGWGNNEQQYYREQNAWVEDGLLTIEARQESYAGKNYTSARMKTQRKKSFQYGRIDIRALLPEGQGLWPALWMLGESIASVGWPSCGEIDMMEMVGGNGRENTVHGTLHWNNNGHAYTGNGYTLSSGTFTDEYHVFSIIWDESTIKWYVNDIQFGVIDITSSHMTEFHDSFFFIFNIAVGGNWPGNPNDQTVFPQQMKVDYIRVFQPV